MKMKRFFLLCTLVLANSAFALPPAPVDEDVEFGVKLSQKQYPDLAVDVLQAVEPKLQTPGQKHDVYGALTESCEVLSLRAYPKMSKAEEQTFRENLHKLAVKYRELRDSQTVEMVLPTSLDQLAEAVTKLINEYAQAANETDEGAKQRAMTRILQNMIKLQDVAVGFRQQAMEKHESFKKTEPDYNAPQYTAWQDKENEIRGPILQAAIEQNRARYYIAKWLPPGQEKLKDQLLNVAVVEIGASCKEYQGWAYTIIGLDVLTLAQRDLNKWEDAAVSADSGLELVERYMTEQPDMKDMMLPFRKKLIISWIYAKANVGKFDEITARVKGSSDPQIMVALAEMNFMKAKALDGKGQKATADNARKQADEWLGKVAAVSEAWAQEAARIRAKWGGGEATYFTALSEFDKTRRERNYAGMISSGLKVLSYGGMVPADKRAQVFTILGYSYLQERMYYEAYVVYTYIASAEADEVAAERYARQAVASLQTQFNETKDSSDKAMFDIAARWQRDNYGGPGKEYSDALDVRNAKNYRKAIELFKTVPKDSLYFEAAAQQVGECQLLLANQLADSKSIKEADEMLANGRASLENFLVAIKSPTSISKIAQRRKEMEPSVVYRLAASDLWPGHENYKACIARTDDFIEKYPAALSLHPFVLQLRIRSFVALDEVDKATDQYERLKGSFGNSDNDKVKKVFSYCGELVFRTYQSGADSLRTQGNAMMADAKKAADPDKAKQLEEQAKSILTKADSYSRMAVEIIQKSIQENPDQPFDRYCYVEYELDRTQDYQKLKTFLPDFIERFSKQKPDPKQVAVLDNAEVLLGHAYYYTGDYATAYELLDKTVKGLDQKYEAARAINPNAQRAPQYLQAKLILGKSAKELVAKDPAKADIAVKILGDLRNSLKSDTVDWWDVSVSMVEVRNSAGAYEDNLLVIGRTISTYQDLGNAEIRARYTKVLDEVYHKLAAPDKKAEALQLIYNITIAQMDSLTKEKKFADALQLVRNFQLYAIDFGGQPNRAGFLTYVETVAQESKDERVIRDARRLAEDLRK